MVAAAVTRRTIQFPEAAEVTSTVLSLAVQDPILVSQYLAGLV